MASSKWKSLSLRTIRLKWLQIIAWILTKITWDLSNNPSEIDKWRNNNCCKGKIFYCNWEKTSLGWKRSLLMAILNAMLSGDFGQLIRKDMSTPRWRRNWLCSKRRLRRDLRIEMYLKPLNFQGWAALSISNYKISTISRSSKRIKQYKETKFTRCKGNKKWASSYNSSRKEETKVNLSPPRLQACRTRSQRLRLGTLRASFKCWAPQKSTSPFSHCMKFKMTTTRISTSLICRKTFKN
mgnify:CR=1 FL=1